MSQNFDAYFEWLAIPPEEQPPNYYRLLGVPLFVDNPSVIEHAADQRMAHLRTLQTGKHSELSQRLLNEVAAARVCLLNPEKKAAYDIWLRGSRQQQSPAAEDSEQLISQDMAELVAAARNTMRSRAASTAPSATAPWIRSPLMLGVAGALVILLVCLFIGLMQRDESPPSKEQVAAVGRTQVGQESGGPKPLASTDPTTKTATPGSTGSSESKIAATPAPSAPPLRKPDDSPGPPPTPAQEKSPEVLKSKAESGPLQTPSSSPPLAVAPFDEVKAKEHQDAWAKCLGVPVEMTNSIGMRFVLIPAGEFYMGSSRAELDKTVEIARGQNVPQPFIGTLEREAPQHRVTISRPFYMGIFEVTQAEYAKVMGTNPSWFSPGRPGGVGITAAEARLLPVEKVSWSDAERFCQRLSATVGEAAAHRMYRLPTEAEWEYTCRAGTNSAFSFGDDESKLGDYAWFGQVRDAQRQTKNHPGGLKKPNAWGLYDMLGNVEEYCSDWAGHNYYQHSPSLDPQGPTSSSWPVVRFHPDGSHEEVSNISFRISRGCWLGARYSFLFRSATRHVASMNGNGPMVGFRAVCEIAIDARGGRPKPGGEPTPAVSAGSPGLKTKVPVPDDAALEAALKLALVTFKLDYDQARDAPALTALAKRILQKATEIQADSPSRFVFLRLARDVAAKAGDSKTAFEAIDRLADSFEIDPWEMKAGVLSNACKQARKPAERKELSQAIVALMKRALDADAFVVAEQMAKLALAEGGKLRDKEIIAQANEGAKAAKQAARTFAQVETALATLKEKPDDPAANLIVGRYQCFVKGDWTKGLKSLVKSSDESLKQLAEREESLASSSQPAIGSHLMLGDAWWNLAQKAQGREHDGMLVRAGYWYRQAVRDIESELMRIKVEGRLEEIAKVGRAIPEAPAQKTFTNSIGMQFVLIPPGEFWMGSTPTEIEWAVQEERQNHNTVALDRVLGEAPRHRVVISRAFYLGVYEVTQAEYQQVMRTNPSGFSAQGTNSARVAGKDTTHHPVEMVAWNDAVQFCQKLLAMPREKDGRWVYRLPTEAEWEYACRAGSTTKWYFGDDAAGLGEHAWFTSNSGGMTHPVGQKRPNSWGLYDTYGNVWEWCLDWYSRDYYRQSPGVNPNGPLGGSMRVNRGGSWFFYAGRCRSASRSDAGPHNCFHHVGFRVARVPADLPATSPVENLRLKPIKPQIVEAGEPLRVPLAVEDSKAGKKTPGSTQKSATKLETFTNSIGMQFVLIPAGEFWMGPTPTEIEWAVQEAKQQSDDITVNRVFAEAPRHRVVISRAFYLGVYEVTQAEYQQVVGANPSHFSVKGNGADKVAEQDTGRHPVEMVSWDEAVQFCQKLSAMPNERITRWVYRLPTEAEWEYACRAGSTTKWYFGDDPAALGEYTWFRDNSSGMTHPVGQKKPNAWGLYDMTGNVWEWCLDWYADDYYRQSPSVNPAGPAGGSFRVDRGCGWGGSAGGNRSAVRNRARPEHRGFKLGFRVARVPAGQ